MGQSITIVRRTKKSIAHSFKNEEKNPTWHLNKTGKKPSTGHTNFFDTKKSCNRLQLERVA